MRQTGKTDIEGLFEQAIFALDKEIETVRERPSSDVLFRGQIQKESAVDSNTADYLFESDQQGIRFAEEIKATIGAENWIVNPVTFDKKSVVLRFPENIGSEISEVQVEWENDFVLQRTKQEIIRLESADDKVIERIERLFNPEVQKIPFHKEIQDDGKRNRAQRSAIEKSMQNRTVFIWGPPGTGKTATLGYIIANYLKNGKRVLFASNTNRAVDVGLLSTLQAAMEIGLETDHSEITRYGDPVLEHDQIEKISFVRQLEKIVEKRREKAAEWSSLISREKQIKDVVEKRLRNGKQPTAKHNMELELIGEKIRSVGGREKLEELAEELEHVNEHNELRKRRLVATTLAKVCTSDLFFDHSFDAVVIDEGSMANLPYLMVLAAKAKWHQVIVGDPMQLPPISVTDDRDASEFLERDIFTAVSGAETSEQLFEWHDLNPEFTSFFDTQYRLEASLADVISTVFYEGRLKTDKLGGGLEALKGGRAYHLIDTSRYNPVLTQKSNERRFQPVNIVHQEIIERLLGNMITRGILPDEIGVMVPFRSTVYDLKGRLYEANLKEVEVGTIHTFQGREKPYIIFDTVMSGESQRGNIRHYTVRPLDETKNGLSVPRLLNVAFSRSQKELMVLADMRHIQKMYGNKFLGRLLSRLKS
jgi:superfamily I DNA and/or RNA helicase